MPKPPVSYEKRVIPVSFGIERGVVQRFQRLVDAQGFNRSEVITELILNYMKLHRGNFDY